MVSNFLLCNDCSGMLSVTSGFVADVVHLPLDV
jgi:hypothetical protein